MPNTITYKDYINSLDNKNNPVSADKAAILDSESSNDPKTVTYSALQGTQGLQGESIQGTQGLQGESIQGTQGLQGESIQGTQGLQGESIQGTQGLQGTTGATVGSIELDSEITSNTTLTAAHAGKYIPVNSATDVEITINANVFDTNDTIVLEQTGNGKIEMIEGSGMTLNGGLESMDQYHVLTIFLKSDSVATIIGGE